MQSRRRSWCLPRPLVIVLLAAFGVACSDDRASISAPGGSAATAGAAGASGGAASSGSGGTGAPGGAPAGGGLPGATGGSPLEAGVPAEGGTIADAGGDVTTTDAASPDGLGVRVESGLLRGKLQYGVREFLGIPFASAPIGPLRLAPPRPAEPWSGTRDATAYRPSCMQPRDAVEGPIDEDCLYLNVFAPTRPPVGGAPVMVFIHGGGFGGGGGAHYSPEWLAGPKDVIVVTVNYRLGRLGFLATPELDADLGVPSGNLGLKDQQLALRWVRDNIAAFGGDSGNVTVFGQSAGSISACYHLFMKGSEALVDRIIMESGACVAGFAAPRSRDDVVQASRAIVNQVCPLAPDPVACLRALPVSALVPPNLISATMVMDVASGPHVDGALLTEAPRELFRRGEFARLPFIGGSNSREPVYFHLFGIPRPANAFEFALTIALLYPDAEVARRLVEHYMPSRDEDAYDAFVRALTDDQDRCPMRHMVQGATKFGVHAYLYSFEIPPAGHSLELDYVFGWPGGALSKAYPGVAPLPPLADIVDATQTYWTRFARTSDPNDGALPEWPRYTRENDAHLVIGPKLERGAGLSRDDCDWWDSQFAR